MSHVMLAAGREGDVEQLARITPPDIFSTVSSGFLLGGSAKRQECNANQKAYKVSVAVPTFRNQKIETSWKGVVATHAHSTVEYFDNWIVLQNFVVCRFFL